MKLEQIGEFGLIRRIMPRFPTPAECHQGIGDDCAVMPLDDERAQLVTTDLLVENVHFLRNRISPEDLGHKALAVNISDIAAMGGTPTAAFLSIGLPAGLEVEWLDAFFEGIRKLGERVGCPLLGGDTTKSPTGIVINIAVLGTAPRQQIKYRSAARPGDVVVVTGTLGDSGAGLRLLLDQLPVQGDHRRYLVHAHHHPLPHLDEGRWLAARPEVHAMMDVSDGIDSDLQRIMEQSGVGVEVDLDTLPLSEPMKAVCRELDWPVLEIAATGGEDYCLLGTVDPMAFAKVAGEYQQHFDRPLWPIGIIQTGHDLRYRQQKREIHLSRHGFDHFKEQR